MFPEGDGKTHSVMELVIVYAWKSAVWLETLLGFFLIQEKNLILIPL